MGQIKTFIIDLAEAAIYGAAAAVVALPDGVTNAKAVTLFIALAAVAAVKNRSRGALVELLNAKK